MKNLPVSPSDFLLTKGIKDIQVDAVRLVNGMDEYLRIDEIMNEYGKLCAKYGAKSIRYQAIELIQEKIAKADNLIMTEILEGLINKIQNLEP